MPSFIRGIRTLCALARYVSFIGRAPSHAAGSAEAQAAAELRDALCRRCDSVDTTGWLPGPGGGGAA